MKLNRSSQLWNYFSALAAVGFLMLGSLSAQEKPKESSGWSDLSEEDQKKLREALRTVWSDPTVLSARENVNRSAQEYQRAVREMIAKQDPETAKLLDRVQRSQSGVLDTAMGGPRKKYPHHMSSGSRLTQIIAPPSMMERMSEAQRLQFKTAGDKAKEKPEVIKAIEELKNLSKADEEIRTKKMEAFRKFRKVYFDAIVKIDPELKELMPSPGSPPPPFGGKGSPDGGKNRPPKPE